MTTLRSLLPVVILLAPGAALAYDEAVSGDLSGDPAAPTPLTLSVGDNILAGTVIDGPDTRDFITFTIPPGRQLVALRLVSWVDAASGLAGNLGFHAINAGATSFVPSTATDNNFLGGDHLGAVTSGTDLLPELADGDTAGVGVSVPLGPGTYSYVVQQTSAILTRYDLRLVISATTASRVPGARPWSALGLGLLLATMGAAILRRRRAH